MTSFIVISKDKNKRDEYLKNFYVEHEIDSFDVTTLTLENTAKQNAQSIGIEDIKIMQKKIFLKPLKSTDKAIILEDAQLLTTEGQNALLKVLEEPPDHTLVILSTESKESLLPTIISRCFVIELETAAKKLSEKERQEFEDFLEELPRWGIGERLKKAEQLAKDKEKAMEWIEKVILVLRKKMLENVILVSDEGAHPESLKVQNENDSGRASLARMTACLRAFQSLHTLLKTTNVNPRFAIENTFLPLT